MQSGGSASPRQVDLVLWAEIRQGPTEGEVALVHSVNAGWVTTHLASEHQIRMVPGKPRSALCGKSLPDAGEPWGQPTPHPPLGRPEKLCPKCLAMISPYAITTEMLPDRAWWIEYGRLSAIYDCWKHGQSAKHNAYTITNEGKTPHG